MIIFEKVLEEEKKESDVSGSTFCQVSTLHEGRGGGGGGGGWR